jgi:hypothetical protein
MESHGGMILTGETEELGDKPVSVPLNTTTNSTLTELHDSLGLRDEWPVSNSMAYIHMCIHIHTHRTVESCLWVEMTQHLVMDTVKTKERVVGAF